MKIGIAKIYYGGGRRWLTLKAACNAEAKARIKERQRLLQQRRLEPTPRGPLCAGPGATAPEDNAMSHLINAAKAAEMLGVSKPEPLIKSIVRTVRKTRGHRQNTARNPLGARFLHSGGQKSPHTLSVRRRPTPSAPDPRRSDPAAGGRSKMGERTKDGNPMCALTTTTCTRGRHG